MLARDGWSAASVRGLDHFWSLALEEQFYLLWPVAVYALSRRRLIALCVCAGLAAPVLRMMLHAAGDDLAAYALMPARSDALAAGALVALLATDPAGMAALRRHARSLAVVAGLHNPLLSLLAPAGIAAALRPYLHSEMLARGSAIVIVLAVCLVVAMISWHFYERPILRLKARFSAASRPAATASAALIAVG
jgi:peptidoglycan/LPS O-acetylase OafA/YrhL